MRTTNIAVHDAPAWREKANFIIFADVTEEASTDRWEQIWARQVTEETFELCCIPFFAYGLSLGDVVQTGASKGKMHVIVDVEQKSGRALVRLWLGKASVGLDEVVKQLTDLGVQFEVSGRRLVAVSVEPGREEEVGDWATSWAEPRGVLFEDG